MKRHYLEHVSRYLSRKVVLITGPRQSGKTTLTKMLQAPYEYINYDDEEGRKTIKTKSWDRKKY